MYVTYPLGYENSELYSDCCIGRQSVRSSVYSLFYFSSYRVKAFSIQQLRLFVIISMTHGKIVMLTSTLMEYYKT